MYIGSWVRAGGRAGQGLAPSSRWLAGRALVSPTRAFSRSSSSVNWLFERPNGTGGVELGGVGVKRGSRSDDADVREVRPGSGLPDRPELDGSGFSESNMPFAATVDVAATLVDKRPWGGGRLTSLGRTASIWD